MKLLDKDGLSYFWAKLKTLLNGKLDADAVSSTGTASTGWNNCRLSGGKIQYYNTNTTYSAATTSSSGLMSASDKTKLNGIDTGATKITVDTVLVSTSTNPVQNKAVTAHIAKLVNDGRKNLLRDTDALSTTINGITFTVNADGTFKLSGTATTSTWFVLSENNMLKAGSYVLTSGVTGQGNNAIAIIAPSKSTSAAIMRSDTIGTATFAADQTGMLFALRVQSGASFSNLVLKPMLCTAADYAVSPEFVPYAPSNRELYEMILALQNAQNGG